MPDPRNAPAVEASLKSRLPRFGPLSKDIIGGHGTSDSLEFKLTYGFNRHVALDRHQNASANKNLASFRFVAKRSGRRKPAAASP